MAGGKIAGKFSHGISQHGMGIQLFTRILFCSVDTQFSIFVVGVDEEVIFSLPVCTSTTSLAAALPIFEHRLQPRKIIIVLTLCGRVALRKNVQNWPKSVKNVQNWQNPEGYPLCLLKHLAGLNN